MSIQHTRIAMISLRAEACAMKLVITVFGLLLSCFVLSACTSAGKCKRGEAGCACTESSSCSGGARCVQGTCVEKSGTKPSADAGSDAGSNADAGADAAVSDAGHDAGSPIDCDATTFAEACRQYCRALCASEANLCVSSQCDPGFCDPGGGQLSDTCDQVCGADLGCMHDLCTGELQRTCDEFGYPDDSSDLYMSGCFNEDPACVINPDYGCSDTCGTAEGGVGGDLAGNGKCEDGGDNSVGSATCPRGTDCTDCGKRTCAQPGDPCKNGGDCCGFYPDTGALCVDLDGDLSTDDAVCLQTCNDQPCDSGTCTQLDQDAGAVCAP